MNEKKIELVYAVREWEKKEDKETVHSISAKLASGEATPAEYNKVINEVVGNILEAK